MVGHLVLSLRVRLQSPGLALKRTELKRKTELKRGTSRLTTDKTKAVAWQRRSAKPLPAYSEHRADKKDERAELVARVLAATPVCQARIAGLCQGASTEVNELKRRSQWAAGYLIEWNTEALCSACHAHVTGHPGRGGWAMRHGHQVSGAAKEDEYVIAIAARFLGLGCSPTCLEDHRRAPVPT